MKKITLTSAFLIVLGFTAAWASEDSYTSQIGTAQFQTRQALIINGNVSPAAPGTLSQPADSTSTTRNILSTQLPTALSKNLKKGYQGYWISELYEQGQDKQVTYYITLENADQIVKLNANGSKNWTVVSTAIKPI